MIKDLEKFLERRPITTLRVALNNQIARSKIKLQSLASYVAYGFISGPWREALILFGVDPRLDPKYRFFQTLRFQTRNKERRGEGMLSRGGSRSRQSHFFDGKHVDSDDCSTWQVCDISDPVIRDIFTASPRNQCDVSGLFRVRRRELIYKLSQKYMDGFTMEPWPRPKSSFVTRWS